MSKAIKESLSLIVYSILAGVCIAIGGTVYLRLKGLFPGSDIIGALLFAVGLFTVCTRGYSLYTGALCSTFSNKPDYLIDLVTIWVGNFIGIQLFSAAESLTTLVGANGIDMVALEIVNRKMAAPLLSLFILGIVCNILMFIAVGGYKTNPHIGGKYLAIFLGVSVFILSGTEHSIADMYYWCISGVWYSDPTESFIRILVISLGNFVGGTMFPLLEKLAVYLNGGELS